MPEECHDMEGGKPVLKRAFDLLAAMAALVVPSPLRAQRKPG